MNLQAIQKRLQELSAEALTLSNALEFLIKGDVTESPLDKLHLQVSHFTCVSEGDVLQFTEPFNHIDDGAALPAGNYKVIQIEEEDYEGIWSVMIVLEGGGNTWINFNRIAQDSIVYKVQAI